MTVSLDTTPAQVDFATDIYTQTAYAPPTVRFSGPLTEAVGIASVALQVGTDSIVGSASGVAWSADWPVDETNLPDGVTYPVTLTVSDVGGHVTTATLNALVDVVAPRAQPSFIVADQPVVAGLLITQSTASVIYTFTVATPTDNSGVADSRFGYTFGLTFTLAGLTPALYNTSQLVSVTLPSDGQAVYFHFVTRDNYGNQATQTFGPVYLDEPTAPDYISMNEPAGPYQGAPYRQWMENTCSYLGQDLRIPTRAVKGAALSAAQKLYATWDARALRLTWSGADWNRDGDLFIYLDTISDQMPTLSDNTYIQRGGNVAYNPYSTTNPSTLMMLPVALWTNAVDTNIPNWPALDRLNADYALWVENNATLHWLRWDNATAAWVDEPLTDTVQFNFAETSELFTDFYLPFEVLSVTTGSQINLVALASENEGLRAWSVIPAANPASSNRVMHTAPAYGVPLRLALTDFYTLTLNDGDCRTPAYKLHLNMTSVPGGLPFAAKDDDVRLTWPYFNPPPTYTATYNGYNTAYQTWLIDYCEQVDPYADECYARRGTPVSLGIDAKLAPYMDVDYPALIPGEHVTYTIRYINEYPTDQSFQVNITSLADDFPGIQWDTQPWLCGSGNIGAFDVLTMTFPANAEGQIDLSGRVLGPPGYVELYFSTVPFFNPDCSFLVGYILPDPFDQLVVIHKGNRGPEYLAIEQPRSLVGPYTNTVSGIVLDDSPVPTITLHAQLNAGAIQPITCPDATPDDGKWDCDINVTALNGGTPPADGTPPALRVLATDIFGMSTEFALPEEWITVTVDAHAPTLALDSATRAALADGLIAPNETRFTGVITDDHLVSAAQVCESGDNCVPASLTVDPATLPTTFHVYNDEPATPITISVAGGGVSNLCGAHLYCDGRLYHPGYARRAKHLSPLSQ